MQLKDIGSYDRLELPKSFEEAEEQLALIGALQRDLAEKKAELDRQKARLDQEFTPAINLLRSNLERQFTGLCLYASEHRNELITNGKKTAQLKTGKIFWKNTPEPGKMEFNEVDLLENARKLGLVTKLFKKVWKFDAAKAKQNIASAVRAGITFTKQELIYIQPNESDEICIDTSQLKAVEQTLQPEHTAVSASA